MLVDDETLHVLPIAMDSYGVLCSAAHGFARRRSIAWSSLHDERIIGSDALDALVRSGIAPRLPETELVVTSRAPLMACVRKDLGIAILPMLTRPSAAAGLAFVPLMRPTLARTLAIVTRRRESLLPAGRRLVDLLGESLRQFARRRGARLL
jgi:DNA-binding transcriptional LysR family regulator